LRFSVIAEFFSSRISYLEAVFIADANFMNSCMSSDYLIGAIWDLAMLGKNPRVVSSGSKVCA